MKRVLAAISWIPAVALLAAAAPAQADFAITSFGGSATDSSGHPVTQAGSHPDVTTDVQFSTKMDPSGNAKVDGSLKDISIDLPAGLIADPSAVSRCTSPDLRGTGPTGVDSCPADSQVGVAVVTVFIGGDSPILASVPLYNMVPPKGVPGQFAFNLLSVLVYFNARVTPSGGYVLSTDVRDASQTLALAGTKVTLWGVPGDPRHDPDRPRGVGNRLLRPLITLPTRCSSVPLRTDARANSWEHPDVFSSASFDHDFDGNPLTVDGCARLPFDPSIAIAPTHADAGAPTGLSADVTMPPSIDPGGLAQAHLKRATVELPEGLAISPSSANGLAACSDDQVDVHGDGAVACSDASKIGTVSIDTPLLADPLLGSVYVGTQRSDDPASGEMFRIFVVADDPERGVRIKLPGAIRADAGTGQLTAVFDDNPQLPFTKLHLEFKDGPRAPLTNATTCGTKTASAAFAAWSGRSATAQSSFPVAGCAGASFSPKVNAGAINPVGGAASPFALSIAKPDGDAALTGLSMVLPTGLLARLKGNIGTQVGTATAFAGPGSSPVALPGQVYLEGAYGDAPFSLRVVVPAKAGPFDLGTVTVRQKIYVDPVTAQVTVVSDPVPTIVKGVPVRLQRLDVSVDKPGFMINPTSCAAKALSGTLGAVDGQTAPINVRFQVAGCGDLALKPALALSLSGKGQTTDGGHPAVSATLTQPAGQANPKKVRVTLPLSLALDPDNSNSDALCSFVEGSKPDPTCPASSVVGRATAVTPILDQPLSGPVYFVKNERKDPKSGRSIKTTPKLVIPLVGENGVKLTLTGASTVVDDQLVTTFDNVPDAPVTSFKLDINGGKKGILVVSDADICKSTQIAEQEVDGQNNKTADVDVYIQTPSCPLKVLSKKVGKSSVAIKVGGLGAGKVTVTGHGIKKTTKTITKSTVATITAKRTKGKPGKVTVSFDPAGPAKARKITR
ncbi:MAG: hypothetical protein ABW167_09440 [Baekduia sp.]